MTSPETAAAFGQGITIYQTCLVAILFWDYLNTLYTEIRVVWKPLFQPLARKQWREAKVENRFYMVISPFLFFIMRYLALIEFSFDMALLHARIGPGLCKNLNHFPPLTSAFVCLCASALMALRLIALWNSAAYIKFPILFLYCCTVAFCLWGSTYTKAVGPPEYQGCLPLATSTYLNGLYLSLACFDFIVVVLTLVRAYVVKRQTGNSTGRLFRVMVRDGLVYFVIIFGVNVIAIAFEFQNLQPLLKNVNASLATIMTSIFGSRIYFNIRKEVQRMRNPKTPFGHAQGSGGGFQDPLAPISNDGKTSGSNWSSNGVGSQTRSGNSKRLSFIPPFITLKRPGTGGSQQTEKLTYEKQHQQPLGGYEAGKHTSASSPNSSPLGDARRQQDTADLLPPPAAVAPRQGGRSAGFLRRKKNASATVQPIWKGGVRDDQVNGVQVTSQQETSVSPPDNFDYDTDGDDDDREPNDVVSRARRQGGADLESGGIAAAADGNERVRASLPSEAISMMQLIGESQNEDDHLPTTAPASQGTLPSWEHSQPVGVKQPEATAHVGAASNPEDVRRGYFFKTQYGNAT